MKQLDGRASAVVGAPLPACFDLLAAIERYPTWSGEFIRRVDAVERDDDGRPVRAHVTVHVAQSPFAKDFEFDAEIRAEPQHAVQLTRLPKSPEDLDGLSLSWSLLEDDGTRIRLDLLATVAFLPSYLPLPGVGDLVARTLLDAAVRALGGSAGPATAAPSST